MYWKPLSKDDTGLYKGIAILMIVIHNFMHLFPMPKENEFGFNEERVYQFFDLLVNDSGNFLRITFSFFGHFGVQVFVFLSAYGLTKKYCSRKLSYREFINDRFVKIYPAFILSILVWSLVVGWFHKDYGILGPLAVIQEESVVLLLKVFLVSNFLPGIYFQPVGPWWFISLIFQFYFIFPVLLYLYFRWGSIPLVILSFGAIVFSFMMEGSVGRLNLYLTVLPHLPEFCLGIYFAGRDDEFRIKPWFLIGTTVLFVLGNFYEAFWYVNHISFLLVLLAVFGFMRDRLNKSGRAKSLFLFMGSISMPLFLVNGFLREPFITWAKEYDNWILTILLCILSVSISISVAFILSKVLSVRVFIRKRNER